MNNKRRKKLKEAGALIGNALLIVECVKDEEQGSIDNMPESLQDCERCQSMERSVSELEDAISCISEASDQIDRARQE